MMHKILYILFLLPILLFSKVESSENENELTSLLSLISKMNNTVHSLQRERGASTGYISSNAQKFRAKLEKIRIKSDEAKEDLLLLMNLDYKALKKYLSSDNHDNLNRVFNELVILREDVDNLNIDFSKTYSKYTQIITYLLLNISDISDRLENKELKDSLYSYSMLLLHKESIGQKRAILSSVFSQKEFSKELYEYFLTSGTQEKIYLKIFLRSANSEIKSLYLKILNAPVAKAIQKYEKLALQKLQGINVNVDSEEFFEVITKKINLIQKIENKLFHDTLALVEKLNNTLHKLLSKEEMLWLSKNHSIKYLYDPDWEPFEWKNGINQHVGIIADILKLIEKKSGIEFTVIHSNTWKDVVLNIKDSKADMIDAMAEDADRNKYLNFTKNNLFSIPYVFVSNNKRNLSNGFEDIKNNKISFIDGYAIESTLKNDKPNIKYGVVQNVRDGFKKVSQGKIDIFLVNQASAQYMLNKKEYKNLKISYYTDYKLDLKIAMRKDYPKEALSIIDKTLNLITSDAINEIYQKWFSQSNMPKDNSLKIAFNFDRPPFMFGETSSKGIESDLVKEILQSRAYKVEISQMSKDYLETVLHTKNDIDGVASIVPQNDTLFYSDDFISFRNYVVTHKKDNIKINSLNDLSKIDFIAWKGAYNDLGKEFYTLFNPRNGTAKDSYSDPASQVNGIREFFNHTVDALVIDKTIFQWYNLKYKNSDEYQFHEIFPKTTSYPVAFKSQKVRDDFNSGLTELKRSGRYDEIINFYLEQDVQTLLEYANLIADISGKFMFEAKDKELENILMEFFKHPDIVHIDIYNKATNQRFLSLYKKNGLIVNDKNIDIHHDLPTIKKDIYFENLGSPLHLGRVNIFYKKDYESDKSELIPTLHNFIGLDKSDKQKLKNSYSKFGFNTRNIELTKEEKEWIKLHKVVRFSGDPDWLPFEAFNSQGQHVGIISEYLSMLEKLTSIKFKAIAPSSWSEAIKLSENKSIDILSETIESNRKHLIFTKPYIMNDIVIVMNKKHNYVESLSIIKNNKIALIKDYGYIKQIQEKFPDIDFVMVDTISAGLTAVSTGKIDALLCTFALGSYTTTTMGISNIKIVGKTQFSMSLGFGVRDDYAPLVNILNKAIKSISLEEHNEIFNHWIKQDYVEKVDYSLLYKFIFGVFLLILIFIFWNRKMANEINKRKIIEDKMKETQERLNLTIAGSGDGLWEVDHIYNTIWWSPQFKEMLGYEDDELTIKGGDWINYVHPDDVNISSNAFNKHIQNDTVYDVIFRMIHKNGDSIWLRSRAKTLRDETKALRTSGSVTNVTELKIAEEEMEYQQQQFTSMVSNIPGVIYRCLLDEHWTMIYISNEVERLGGYPASDYLNNSVRTFTDIIHPEDVEYIANYVQNQIDKKESYLIDYRIIRKNGDIRWVRDEGLALFSDDGSVGWLDGVIFDITKQKELEFEIQEQKDFVQILLDSQEQIIITTDGKILLTVNETFLDFFAVDTVKDFTDSYNAQCIDEIFNTHAPEGYLQINMGRETWIDYVISRSFGETHKAMISIGNSNFIFSVTATKLPGNKGIKSAVFTNITEMENAKIQIETINKHTRESIEYASLIQGALIPNNEVLKNYFQDYFAIWQPKDIVGGDIYLFEELREDECLMMLIDCTGHGVPGAFVTMLVKAIESQIIAKINNDINIDVSPAWILKYFNKTMKKLLQQENKDSISNAGFDGGIIYYNKKENILKFAGAETSLFYIEDTQIKTIKGNRHSVGYKKSDVNYEFKEHILSVKQGTQFYLTTDGYIDQNGGIKGFPFSKRRFTNLINEYAGKPMKNQREVLLARLAEYQGNEERNDDVTLVGFKI